MVESLGWPFSRRNQFYLQAQHMEKHHGAITFIALIGIFVFTVIPITIVTLIFRAIGLDLPHLITNLMQFMFFIFWVWLYAVYVEKRPFESLGFWGDKKLQSYSKGLALGAFLVTISITIISVFSEVHFVYTFNFDSYSALSMLLVLIFFIIQGASEEIVMRGWFMQSIAVKHWPWLGFLLSSLVFACMHAANPNFSGVACLNILLIGFFLALLVLHNENLWGACGFHTAWNFTMNSVFGINVSGNNLMGKTLATTTFEGNSLITGGEFGLEGSLIVTAIAVVGCLALLFSKKLK